MKYFLITLLVVALIVFVTDTAAAGGDGFVSVYSDESGTNCNVLDGGDGLVTVYVIYKGPHVTSAVQFKLEQSAGAALTYVGETLPADLPGGMFGRADIGVSVAYGTCVDPPVRMLDVHYWGLGVSDVCSKLTTIEDPNSVHNEDLIQVVVCDGSDGYSIFVPGGHAVINPDESCECDAETGGIPTPVAQTTWGGIKAMYVD
jgi:hypothetical protein